MLGEWEGAAGEEDVVIGGEQGYKAEHDPASGLEEAQTVEAEAPGALG